MINSNCLLETRPMEDVAIGIGAPVLANQDNTKLNAKGSHSSLPKMRSK